MPIPDEHKGRYVYHFTHFDNLEGLLRRGFLAKNHAKFPGKTYRSIAAESIQERRAAMAVPCGPGGLVHDYVPLYFGSRSPMLLSLIRSKNVDQYAILYFEFPISLSERADVIFTDASANRNQPPNFYVDPASLAKLDWNEIDSLKWRSDSEAAKQRRMAELLVHRQLDVTEASRCVVWNKDVKKLVQKVVGDAPFPVIEEHESPGRYHWFTNLPGKKSRESLVLGPMAIAARYKVACKEIVDGIGEHEEDAPFATIGDLLEGLRANFDCLPHTAELVGLESDNGMHKLPVDEHTLEVVSNLRTLPEFDALGSKAQMITELAAYLHDIGKGPRSRWDDFGGRQQVDPDHPVLAMPMMVEILTEQVGTVRKKSARALTKLVCYHDLIGEVLGKDRAERQIVDVADDKEDLDMLFALGKADATALNDEWWDQARAGALYDRCLEAVEAKAEE